ncbi:MAG TPA: tetratricopeptide repeat protein [Terriglobia bacterium]|nr:tetratricopeptide repeat protein [Terriglobia bacterium]
MPRKTPGLAVFTLSVTVAASALGASGGFLTAGLSSGQAKQVEAEAPAQIASEAQAAMRQGDYDLAIRDFARLVKIAPQFAESHANLGIACYSAGRFPEAVPELRTALKLKPSLSNARYFLGLSLAKSGQCREAVSYLTKDYTAVRDPQLKREMGTEAVRCTMASNETDKAVDVLRALDHDFPADPGILYLSSHVYSDLATRASERLLFTAPDSVEAHETNAEILELQGKLDDAAQEYRKILASNPQLPGMHYHLGRLLLSGPQDASTQAQAQQEFEEELKINPSDALSEYELGELARRARRWDDAIQHFAASAKFDPTLADALIGLGKSLLSAGRAPEAVTPLDRALSLEPDNLAAHYELSLAYRRLGRTENADREESAYQKLRQKRLSRMDAVATGMAGRVSRAQTAEPPQ